MAWKTFALHCAFEREIKLWQADYAYKAPVVWHAILFHFSGPFSGKFSCATDFSHKVPVVTMAFILLCIDTRVRVFRRYACLLSQTNRYSVVSNTSSHFHTITIFTNIHSLVPLMIHITAEVLMMSSWPGYTFRIIDLFFKNNPPAIIPVVHFAQVSVC